MVKFIPCSLYPRRKESPVPTGCETVSMRGRADAFEERKILYFLSKFCGSVPDVLNFCDRCHLLVPTKFIAKLVRVADPLSTADSSRPHCGVRIQTKGCIWNTVRSSYRGADKSLARPGRKQAQKHVKDARDFNNFETRAVIKRPPPNPARQGAEGNSRHSDRNISLFPSSSG